MTCLVARLLEKNSALFVCHGRSARLRAVIAMFLEPVALERPVREARPRSPCIHHLGRRPSSLDVLVAVFSCVRLKTCLLGT